MDTEEVRRLAREVGLADIADALVGLVGLAIRLDPAPDRALERGMTKLGGLPDLPAGARWPHVPPPLPETGMPMLFIAQIDVAGLGSFSAWPAKLNGGLLSFFCAGDDGGAYVEDPGGAHVLFTPPEVTLERPSPPADLPTVLGGVPLRARPELTLPGLGVNPARALAPLGFHVHDELDGPQAERDDRYLELFERLERAQAVGEPRHRLLGHPMPVQGDVIAEAQRIERWTEEENEQFAASDWRLLLQVDHDYDRLGVLWGDAGTVYFCVPSEDLAAGTFGGVEVIVQTT